MKKTQGAETEPRPPLGNPRLRAWLDAALADADRRGLRDIEPLLESLAVSTEALRAADWNADAEE
jgi:hypothetical protein